MDARRILGAVAALVTTLPGGCRATRRHRRSARSRRCSWSYFGDPRSVAHEGHVFTGCIGADGRRVVEDLDLDDGRRRLRTLFEPSRPTTTTTRASSFFRERLFAFSSPHSGYLYPRDRRSRMRYRVSPRPWTGGGWGRTRTVPLGHADAARLHVPQPGRGGRPALPVHARSVLGAVLHLDGRRAATGPRRGRSSQPSPSLPGPRRHPPGAPVREVRGRAGRLDPDGVLRRASRLVPQRPLLRPLQDGRFFGADGRAVGTVADLPLRFDQLDRIEPYSPAPAAPGRWTSPRARRRAGGRVLVLVGASDRSGTRAGTARWRTHRSSHARARRCSLPQQGVDAGPRDPSWVVLSRTIDGQNEIEARHTPDGGEQLGAHRLTRDSRSFNIRP